MSISACSSVSFIVSITCVFICVLYHVHHLCVHLCSLPCPSPVCSSVFFTVSIIYVFICVLYYGFYNFPESCELLHLITLPGEESGNLRFIAVLNKALVSWGSTSCYICHGVSLERLSPFNLWNVQLLMLNNFI